MTARHSTGVAEPVPAVDDELIRDLHQELSRWFFYGNNVAHRIGDLLASDPMQRLRDAWSAEAARETDKARSELRAAREGHHLALVATLKERDEARTEVDRMAKIGESTAETTRTLSQERIDTLSAEVERLRAAVLDLPDVGPVSRHAHDSLEPFECLVVSGTHFVRTDRSDQLRRVAAVYLTAAAEIDREAEERAAADTTTANEPSSSPSIEGEK